MIEESILDQLRELLCRARIALPSPVADRLEFRASPAVCARLRVEMRQLRMVGADVTPLLVDGHRVEEDRAVPPGLAVAVLPPEHPA